MILGLYFEYGTIIVAIFEAHAKGSVSSFKWSMPSKCTAAHRKRWECEMSFCQVLVNPAQLDYV